MATMAMDMEKSIKNNTMQVWTILASLALYSSSVYAGEWTFSPNVGVKETYTNNVELNPDDLQSSFVTQAFAGFDTQFKSREAELSFTGTGTYAAYSHNSDLNNDYQAATLDGSVSLWRDGPQLIAKSQISNINQNDTRNSLGDIVSGDTIQQRSHSAGISYDNMNNSHKLNASLIYHLTTTEDGIGESKGYNAAFNSTNGSNARNVFWQVDGSYSDRQNGSSVGSNYRLVAQVGAITSFKLNPFVMVNREDITGTAAGTNQKNTNSWGPGIRWQASDHFYLDLSYSYVEDNTDSDDYMNATINWQPSQRTSLVAGYSHRFFGDSYDLNFSHRTKRLTNKISYYETIEIYDRDSYEQVNTAFWCPKDGPFDENSCFPISQPPSDTTDYILVPFSGLIPVENNEFTVNKRLNWSSTLSLSRTSFTFNVSTREREGIDTGSLDQNFDVSIGATRKLTPKSNIRLLASYRESDFSKNSALIENTNQEDVYKTISATYQKALASSLSANFNVTYLNRESNKASYNYDEVRAYINIKKVF
jgi:uncharacterized protein (PEP-CTERM system associated)